MSIIYCYTNKINGKKYVGQTNNEKRRIREHKSCAFNEKSYSYNLPFHKAIRKYSFENFIYEKLEDNLDNQKEVDEREKYWIKEKQSLIGEHGYNILSGGQEKFRKSSLNQEQIDGIKKMIKDGCSYNDIVKKYSISKTFISNINSGWYFYDEKEQYPLKAYRLDDETIQVLIDYLEESELSFRKIAEVMGLSESTVKKINYGTLRNGLVDSYPIRKITPVNKKAEIVIDLLLNTLYSKIEIMEEAGVSEATVIRINNGETHRKEDLTYPLRNL